MSLKGFHIFFITVSSLLAFAFGIWCFVSEVAGRLLYTCMGIGSIVIGAFLIFYGKKFLEKMKKEGID